MLAVQGGHDFAGVQVFKRYNAGLLKPEFLLDGWLDRDDFRLEDAAPQDRRHFDLDLNASTDS